ncbi:hypothetical protein BN1723_006848 [Verticillium longisporum]|uniref:Aminomethyltransferase folate-binding domain-containing protein n=1 Tax=Verticillium longisporum TaxID=100787 RepID=A0A0G4NI12_VERLO|nr:hypothetical protein BN1723_006848 [Verticillium longisporum]
MRPLLRSAAPAPSACRLLPRRPFSSSACRSALPPPPPPAAYAPLPSRRLISVSGPDTAKFLQGVITANINAPGPLYAAFLTATGRILNDVFIYPDTLAIGAGAPETSFLIEADAEQAPFLQGVITANINAPGPLYAAFLTATGRILNDVFIYPDTLAIGAGAPETSFLIEADADQAPVLAKHIRRYKLRAKFDVRLLDDSDARVWHLWNDAAPDPPAQSTAAGDLMPDRRAPGMGYRLYYIIYYNPII